MESHNGKAVRAELYQQLENVSDRELLELCECLLTLQEVGRRFSERYKRIQLAKANMPRIKIDLLPGQIHQLRYPQPVPVANQN